MFVVLGHCFVGADRCDLPDQLSAILLGKAKCLLVVFSKERLTLIADPELVPAISTCCQNVALGWMGPTRSAIKVPGCPTVRRTGHGGTGVVTVICRAERSASTSSSVETH